MKLNLKANCAKFYFVSLVSQVCLELIYNFKKKTLYDRCAKCTGSNSAGDGD